MDHGTLTALLAMLASEAHSLTTEQVMLNYLVTSRNETIRPFRVHAHSYQHAAEIAARRLHGRKRGLVAVRVTGDAGLSGYWQAYVPVTHGTGLTSWGRNYHVICELGNRHVDLQSALDVMGT